MALENCSNCPSYCLGNLLDSECVVYDGQSLESYLNELQQVQETPASTPSQITSDNVISNSLVRNRSSICSSAIVDRSFTYTINTNTNGVLIGWNLLGFIRNLPIGYNSSVVRVRVAGTSSRNVIADSSSTSTAIPVKINQLPVTVDFLVRVSSPCGDIDMEYRLNLIDLNKTGEFRAEFIATDLNPLQGQIILTDQLNSIESQLQTLGSKVESLPDVSTTLASQSLDIETLQSEVGNPSNFQIDYTKNGGSNSGYLSPVISDLYSKIETLEATINSQELEIDSLRAKIDAINAS